MGEDDKGAGWVTFAGVMLLILGWAIWLIGIAQGLTGVAVLVKNQFARRLGVACRPA
jgi:hypothetical protein